MPRTFMEVAIAGEEALLEQLVGLLSQVGFEGFWEDGGTLRGYIDARHWTPALKEEVDRIVALTLRPSADRRPSLTISALDDRNWNEEWERTIRPIHVTDRIVISPFAAKRLSMLLGNVVKEYENRFGTLNIEAAAGGEAKK